MTKLVFVLSMYYLFCEIPICLCEGSANSYSSTVVSSGVIMRGDTTIVDMGPDIPQDDAVLRNIGLNFFLPESNCIELFGKQCNFNVLLSCWAKLYVGIMKGVQVFDVLQK